MRIMPYFKFILNLNKLNTPGYIQNNVKTVYSGHSSGIIARETNNQLSSALKHAETDVSRIPSFAIQNLRTESSKLKEILSYSFSSPGKLLRPLLVTLTAATANFHNKSHVLDGPECPVFHERCLDKLVSNSQFLIALITEMIHTATLIHDDVLDSSDLRRGQPSVFHVYGSKNATLTGSFILTSSSHILSLTQNHQVISVLSRVLDDLLRGETLQLIQAEDEDNRFKLYFKKTYGKTASLIANACKAVTMLSDPNNVNGIEGAFQFGRHLGMAFQLIDDVLDFSLKDNDIGKPSGGADLSQGIITAPVLFASQQFDEVATIISRNFSELNDVVKVVDYVHKSNGLQQTRMLAEFHFQEALRQIFKFVDSPYRRALLHVAAKFVQRNK